MRVGVWSAQFSDGAHAGRGGNRVEKINIAIEKFQRQSHFAFRMLCTIHDCIPNAEFIQLEQIVYCFIEPIMQTACEWICRR